MIITGHAKVIRINIEINKDSQIVDKTNEFLKFYLIYHNFYHGGS